MTMTTPITIEVLPDGAASSGLVCLTLYKGQAVQAVIRVDRSELHNALVVSESYPVYACLPDVTVAGELTT